MDAVADPVAGVRAALTGLGGVLPRRAVVLPDGTVGDRSSCPTVPEARAISVACEILRRAQQEPVFSRLTPDLMAQCVDTNHPGAWRALLDDVGTGDLDLPAAAAFWSKPANLERVVQCMADAHTGMHLWLVVRALHNFLPEPGTPLNAVLGDIFHSKFNCIIRCVTRRTQDVSPDMRAGVVETLGRLIMWCKIPDAKLVNMLHVALTVSSEDVLRLFVYAPVKQMVDKDAGLVDRVLQRAERAQLVNRYPACALLAAMDPEQLRGHEARVQRVVQKTLTTAAAQKSIDPKLGLVCGALAKAVSPPGSLLRALSHALCCMALNLTRATSEAQ